MNLKQVAGWAVAILAAWLIITNPVGAAHLVHNIGAFLATVAHSITVFFASI